MANEISTLAADAFRDYVTAGNPLSGNHDPVKGEIITLFDEVNDKVEAALAAAADNFAEFVTAAPSTNANGLLDGFHIATAGVGLNFPDTSSTFRVVSYQATAGAVTGNQIAVSGQGMWLRAKAASTWGAWTQVRTAATLPRASLGEANAGTNVDKYMTPDRVLSAILANGTVQVGSARVAKIANEIADPSEKSGNSAWATGNAATAFLMQDGTIMGCGSSFTLGLPITADVPIFLPRQIPVESRADGFVPVFSQVATSQGAVYALDQNGHPWSAGLNATGALGHGDTTQRRALKRIEFFPTNSITVSRIVTPKAGGPIGDFVHFITASPVGHVYACGANGAGQLGDASTTQRNTPVRCGTIANITRMVTAGGLANALAFGFVGALQSDGQLWLWGLNVQGAVGDGTTVNRTTPHASLASVIDFDLDAGFLATVNLSYAVAVLTGGATRGIGYNITGQIGDGTIVNKSAWAAGLVTGASAVWTGGGPTGTTLYRGSSDQLRAIGHNGQGQCGIGSLTTPQLTVQTPQFNSTTIVPLQVIVTGQGLAVSTTRVHVRTTIGGVDSVVCFGAGATGVLSTEGAFTASVSLPRLIPGLSPVALAPAGDATGGLAARTSAGRVFAGGTNNEGALGISTDLLTAYDGFSPVVFGA